MTSLFVYLLSHRAKYILAFPMLLATICIPCRLKAQQAAAEQVAPQELQIARDRSASIQGRVTDNKGAPLIAGVMVYGRTIVNGKVDLFAMCSTTSHIDGTYDCTALRPGSYIVSATTRNFAANPTDSKPEAAAPKLVYPRTFSPSTTELSDSFIVQLGHGSTGIADVIVRPDESATVRGKLASMPNHPSFLLRGHLGSLELPIDGSVKYDPATGNFTITGVPKGAISLGVDWSDAGRVYHEYGIADVVPGRENTVITALIGRHHVSGHLVLSTDEASSAVLPQSVQLLGLGDRSGWHLEAQVSPDGYFAFPEIADGDYAVHVKPASGFYVEAIADPGKSGDSNVIRLHSDTQDKSIDVLLDSTQAQLSGKVPPDEVVPDKTHVLLESLRDTTLMLGDVDLYGRFSFAGIPPGDYNLYAWKDMTSVAYRNANVLAVEKNHSREVHIDNDSHLTGVELSLISADR
jgi:hypothetical protein